MRFGLYWIPFSNITKVRSLLGPCRPLVLSKNMKSPKLYLTTLFAAVAIFAASPVAAQTSAAEEALFEQTQGVLDEIHGIEDDIDDGQPDRAIKRANALVLSSPSGLVYKVRGKAFYAAKRLDEAIADFTKALSFYNDKGPLNDSSRAELFLARGDAHYYKNNHEAFVADYVKVLQYGGKSRLEGHIKDHVEKKELSAALSDYAIALANIDKKKAQSLYYRRGELHMAAGKTDDAISDFRTVLEIDPKTVFARYHMGRLFMNRKDYASAIDVYTLAIKNSEPKSLFNVSEWYNLRADAYAGIGIVKMAIADYTASIAAFPGQTNAYLSRGKLYATKEAGEGQKGIADYTFVIDRETRAKTPFAKSTKMAEVYTVRGALYIQLNNEANGLADLNKAIEIDPKYPYPFYFRSILYCDNNKPDLAKKDEATVVALGFKIDKPCSSVVAGPPTPQAAIKPSAPKTAKDWYDQGMANVEDRDLFEAVEAFTKAIALKPDYWNAYAQRASADFASGGHTTAFNDINKAIKMSPKVPSYYLIRSSFHCYNWEIFRTDTPAFDLAKRDEATATKLGGKVEYPCK